MIGRVFLALERLGLAAWFGASLWFSAFGTTALFGGLGAAGAAASLGVLFRSLFWFAAGSGAVALAGSLGQALGPRPRAPTAGLRLAMSATVLAAGLVLSLAIEPAFTQSGVRGPTFDQLHATSVVVAFLGWVASGVGLVAGAGGRAHRG